MQEGSLKFDVIFLFHDFVLSGVQCGSENLVSRWLADPLSIASVPGLGSDAGRLKMASGFMERSDDPFLYPRRKRPGEPQSNKPTPS